MAEGEIMGPVQLSTFLARLRSGISEAAAAGQLEISAETAREWKKNDEMSRQIIQAQWAAIARVERALFLVATGEWENHSIPYAASVFLNRLSGPLRLLLGRGTEGLGGRGKKEKEPPLSTGWQGD